MKKISLHTAIEVYTYEELTDQQKTLIQKAKDMDSHRLKEEFGSQLTFWGGGIDTQQILPFGTPDEIRRHVIGQCELLVS